MAINPFILPPSERLSHWKTFRRSLPSLSDTQQLEQVAAYFAQAPIITIACNLDTPNTWPTIWEMVSAGEWCRNSTAIGIYATLHLAGWAAARLDLRHVIDHENSVMVLVVLVDGNTLLNYDWGVTKLRPAGMRTFRRYGWTGHSFTLGGRE